MTEKRAWIPAPGFVSLAKKPNGGLAFLMIQREGGKAKLKAVETLGNIEVEDEAFIPFLVPHLEAVEEAFHTERGVWGTKTPSVSCRTRTLGRHRA